MGLLRCRLLMPSLHAKAQPLDSIPYAFVAPVTAAAYLFLLPGLIIALLGYHQEMLPTPFLLGLASRRESAPLPVVAEVLALMVIDEILREARARLPTMISPGMALASGVLIILLMMQAGIGVPFLQEDGAYRTAKSWRPGAVKEGARAHE